jgi:hypothetical protein
MSGQVRPFRKSSVPQLVEMVVKWRGETKVLVELVTELEFRQGKIARSIQATRHGDGGAGIGGAVPG